MFLIWSKRSKKQHYKNLMMKTAAQKHRDLLLVANEIKEETLFHPTDKTALMIKCDEQKGAAYCKKYGASGYMAKEYFIITNFFIYNN